MSDFSLFLGKFLRHGTAIASLRPEQPLAVADDGPEHRLGPRRGHRRARRRTGPITRVLAERARPDCRVVVLERDPDFARLLRERFERPAQLRRHRGGRPRPGRDPRRARDRPGRLRRLGPARPLVPQGPPAQPLPGRQAGARPEGTYNQITEMPWVYWRFYRRFFEEVRFVFEPRNFPRPGPTSAGASKDPEP